MQAETNGEKVPLTAERCAFDALVTTAYPQLRSVAARELGRFSGASRICQDPDSILAEGLKNILGQRKFPENLGQLRGVMTEAIRRALIDRSRSRNACKRGGGAADSDAELLDIADPQTAGGIVANNEAVARVERGFLALLEVEPRRAECLWLATQGRMSNRAIAEHMKVSLPTVERDISFGKAWIAEYLDDSRNLPIPSPNGDGSSSVLRVRH
ncbi:MAG: hypothetical protein EXS10_06750 [Phycisphaerales bacterium]|nr:hypothetical protein [Phycisphaerales bacterium]